MENKQIDIQPAVRLSLVKEYYFSRKLKEINEMRKQGIDVISLAIGSPDLPPSPKTVEELCKTASEKDSHGYQPSVGIEELRRSISTYYNDVYGVDINPHNEVLPLIGSKEGILHVTLAFVNPGDKVLVPNPGYPTYTSLSKLLGAQVVYYNLKEEDGWQPDFEELENLVDSSTRLLWVNYPNMPTGAPPLPDTFRKLVAFARKHNIVVVNDNPYSRILNEYPMSLLAVAGAKDYCIEFNSMSKSHNMPGWRLGMCLSNSKFISWILKVKSNIDSGIFRGIQLAAARALENDTQWHQVHNIDIYKTRRKHAEKIMNILGCSFDNNQVGMFLWGKIPDSYTDAEQLTEKLLHEAGVFITPGFIFGSNGSRYIRISLCADESLLKEAFNRIKNL